MKNAIVHPVKFVVTALAAVIMPMMLRAQVIEITAGSTSMVLTVNAEKELLFSYLGPKIDNVAPFAEKQTYRRTDYCTDPQAYGARGGADFRLPAIAARYADGDANTLLRYRNHETKTIHGIETTSVTLSDAKNPLEVMLVYEAYPVENVIVCRSVISNRGKTPIVLENYYSSMISLKAQNYYLTHFHGAWAREMTIDETRLTHGVKSIETVKGVRTTHTENPSFMLSLNHPRNENEGAVFAGALVWSGNYRLNFQVDEFDILTLTSGINPDGSAYTLDPGEKLETPGMIYTFSVQGAGQASRNLHDWGRRYAIWKSGKTPTLLNSWEGVYFKFDVPVLKTMIDDAAGMGLEMFVLDDGWFGHKYPRDASNQGLGDWQVDTRKLPKGIAEVASYAKSQGLQFGIWIEPEMVNPRSELAEKHPDWIVGSGNGRPMTTIRNQWLLDLCNPAVQDFVFGVFDNIMKASPDISYIKWDANRHVDGAWSPFLPAGKQSHFAVEYVRGLYKVYERIRAQYPDVIIQACASGGGRVEYGALRYHNEAWTSDNSDAGSRAFIQYGMSMIYPASIIGSHVAVVPSHQTGRITPLKFRFDMAMSGRLGMELQPRDLNDEEKAAARRAITDYKSIRDLVMEGDLYRLSSPYEGKGWYSLMYVSKDKRRAVVYVYCMEYQGRTLIPRIMLDGLSDSLNYRLKELNTDQPSFWGEGKIFHGSYLRNEGINPRLIQVYDSAVYLLTAE